MCKPSLSPVTKIGLFVVEPEKLVKNEKGEYLFKNAVSWQEIKRNDEIFLEFLREVMTLLSQNNFPSSGRYCSYCKYTKNFNNLAF